MNAENGAIGTVRRLNPRVAGAAVAVMVVSVLGIAAITGLLPGAVSQKSASVAPSVGGDASAAVCSICGTVESIRSVEVRGEATAGHPALVYRVTVRMNDGSFRTLSQATAPAFAVGDKVRVMQGTLRAPSS
jgi:outer membrane lipoprotein SlyB